MKIQFMYFRGCPHAEASWENLVRVYKDIGLNINTIEKIDVESEEMAKDLNFPGSPSILINGKDIYDGSIPRAYHYACRVYDWPQGRSGVIDAAFISGSLERILKGQ